MASERYRALLSRRDALRAALVPRQQSATGRYHNATLERAAAYPVMIHAEIEAYIEDSLAAIVESAVVAWRNRQRVTRPLVAIVTYREGNAIGFPDDIFNMNPGKRLETIVLASHAQWKARLRANHGVRGPDLARLFLSAGFVPPSSDQTVINALDGFGARRGQLAHTSPVSEPRTLTDPITEANEIDSLLSALASLDASISAFRSRCRL